MTRIADIEKEEELKKKSTLKLDKDSSARIIKRSLWMHANKKTKEQQSSQDNNDEASSGDSPLNKRVKFND